MGARGIDRPTAQHGRRLAVALVLLAGLLVVLGLRASGEAQAQNGFTTLDCPMHMTFIGAGSGQIGASTFGVSGFIITAVGDTIEEPSATNDFRRFIPTDSSVTVENVGQFEVATPPMTVVNEDGYISFWTADGKGLVLGPFVNAWNMESDFGTVGVGSLEGWSSVDVRAETGQRITFDDRFGIEMRFNATLRCPAPTSTPTLTPTPTPTNSPIVVEVPTPTVEPTPTPTVRQPVTPVPQLTPEPQIPAADPTADVSPPNPDPGVPSIENSTTTEEIIDPYECGADGGTFRGSVSGGTPPYLLSYELNRGDQQVNLPPFALSGAGDYVSPSGYVGAARLPTAQYSVTARVTDALGASFATSFGANIVPRCPASASAGASGGGSGSEAGPALFGSAATTAAGPGAPTSELAHTGARRVLDLELESWGLLFVGFGALSIGAATVRRERQS